MPASRRLTPKLKKHSHRPAKPSLAEQITTPPPPRPTIEQQADTLFDVTGLADYLSVPDSWIYAATAKGSTADLPFIKLEGRFLRFRRSDPRA